MVQQKSAGSDNNEMSYWSKFSTKGAVIEQLNLNGYFRLYSPLSTAQLFLTRNSYRAYKSNPLSSYGLELTTSVVPVPATNPFGPYSIVHVSGGLELLLFHESVTESLPDCAAFNAVGVVQVNALYSKSSI